MGIRVLLLILRLTFFTIKREVIKLNSSMKIPFEGLCPLLRLRYLSSALISNFVLLRVHFLIALLCFLFFSLSPTRKFTFLLRRFVVAEWRFDLVTLHGVLCYRWPIFVSQSSRQRWWRRIGSNTREISDVSWEVEVEVKPTPLECRFPII